MNNAIQLLVDTFKEKVRSTTKELRKVKPVRMRIKATGQWLETNNKKTIWKRKGDASNALALFLEQIWTGKFNYKPFHRGCVTTYEGPDNQLYTYEQVKEIQKIAKQQIKDELLEFVEVDS